MRGFRGKRFRFAEAKASPRRTPEHEDRALAAASLNGDAPGYDHLGCEELAAPKEAIAHKAEASRV